MAIESTDLLVAYRPANKTHYKLSISDFPQELPSGNTEGDYLRWSGSEWEPANTIDGGEYAT